jgi:hypothetical protein
MKPDAATDSGTTVAPPPATATKIDEARSLMPALAALVIMVTLGLGMIFLAWWGARYARRRMGGPLGPSHPLTDEWYSKPLTDRPPPASDHNEESEMGS